MNQYKNRNCMGFNKLLFVGFINCGFTELAIEQLN